jgi:hypothetical protein
MKNKLLLFLMFFMILSMCTVPFIVQADDTYLGEGLTIRHMFENDSIVIDTFYKTDYQSGYWKITDNKNVEISLRVIYQQNDTVILVEHMHADVLIFANNSQPINGITQDSMDDSFHGDQGGFFVSTNYTYNCVFAVEGFSQFLINSWTFMYGAYGYYGGTMHSQRLTEDSLISLGVQGSEIMVVFDLLVKNGNETLFHTYSFMDDFVVFFNGAFVENLGGVLEPPEEPATIDTAMLLVISIIGAIIIIAGVYELFSNH